MKTRTQLFYEMAADGRSIEDLLAVSERLAARDQYYGTRDGSKFLVHAFTSLLPSENYKNIQRYIAEYELNHWRNRALLAFAKVGRSLEVNHLVSAHGTTRLLAEVKRKVPIVLLFAHYGPQRGVLQSVSDLSLSVTGIQQTWGKSVNYPGVDLWQSSDDAGDAVKYFPLHAVSVLRENGIVMLALDGDLGSSSVSAPCFGRMISFRQGVFSIQKATKATVIPVYTRWSREGFIETYFDQPLIQGDELTPAVAAGWLQNLIADAPGNVRWPLLKRVMDSSYIR